jgi:hypothetical protein
MNTNWKMGRLLKVGMYLLSLWLLFVLIIVNKINIEICFSCNLASKSKFYEILQTNYLSGICLLFLIISLIFYFWFKFLIEGASDGPKKILEINNKGSEHLVFLATYVIPLVGFGLDNPRQVINLGITLFIIGAIYIKTNLFYANPTLSLLGFKIFSAKIDGIEVMLISTENIVVGDSINYLGLDAYVYFARKAIRV